MHALKCTVEQCNTKSIQHMASGAYYSVRGAAGTQLGSSGTRCTLHSQQWPRWASSYTSWDGRGEQEVKAQKVHFP